MADDPSDPSSPEPKQKNIPCYYAILQKDKLKLFTNKEKAFEYFTA
jgi:hypothetical protein